MGRWRGSCRSRAQYSSCHSHWDFVCFCGPKLRKRCAQAGKRNPDPGKISDRLFIARPVQTDPFGEGDFICWWGRACDTLSVDHYSHLQDRLSTTPTYPGSDLDVEQLVDTLGKGLPIICDSVLFLLENPVINIVSPLLGPIAHSLFCNQG